MIGPNGIPNPVPIPKTKESEPLYHLALELSDDELVKEAIIRNFILERFVK